MPATHQRFQEVVEQADLAGQKAVEDCRPTPMIVGTPKNMAASLLGGDDGGFDPDEPIYHVPGGPCGFAWVNCKADDTEGRKFLNWLKGSVKTEYPVSVAFGTTDTSEDWWRGTAVMAPKQDSYYKGVSIWVSVGGQSMQIKEAYGNAFAKVLNDAGIAGLNAYCMSRMD